MEYRKRCKVCGKIWCYTDQDLKDDAANSVTSALHAIGGIASAIGGNVFHNQFFADRMENDDRKRVNRDQCPYCHSLDCETISSEEWENYKTQVEFSKVQVSVNGNASTESLLIRTKLLLEDKDWATANAYCDNILDVEPENGMAYLYKLMAELRVSRQEELKDKAEPFDGRANYQKTMRYADEAVKQDLKNYICHIKTRNENERVQRIYNDACNRMNSATTVVELNKAAEDFGTILTYKDSKDLQQKCLEKVDQIQNEAAHKAIMARKRNKKILIFVSIAVIATAIVALFARSNSKKADAYNEATKLAESDEYINAIKAFTDLGSYKDSEEKADVLQETAYQKIFTLLDKGKYDDAYQLCKDLGDYKDCAELAEQIDREYENYYKVYNVEEITDETIKDAKRVLAENELVKNDSLARSVYLFEQFDNKKWECVSGDNSTLSKAYKDAAVQNIARPTITTEFYKQSNWSTVRQLKVHLGDKGIAFGISGGSSFKYDEDTNSYKWTETCYVGADYTITYTEDGILHILAETADGSIFECEYKQNN